MEQRNSHPKVYIVDDHEIMREMLCMFISIDHDLELCGAAASGEEALRELLTLDCDLAIVDVAMPGMSGIELVRRIREKKPELRCLMLSGHAEQVYVQDSLAAGAQGYVMKGNPDTILHAIRSVLNGETYLSDTVRDLV